MKKIRAATANISGHEETLLHLRMLFSCVVGCNPSKIKKSSRLLEDLGIDSFAAMEMLVAIEKEYRVRLSETDIVHLVTVSDLIDLIFSKISQRRVCCHHLT